MDIMIKDGDYAAGVCGGVQTVDGIEELAQRVTMKLTAKRGHFWPKPDYGSRLHTLCRLKPAERSAAARQYAVEALSPEPEISVGAVDYLPGADDSALLRIELICGGQNISATLTV